MGASNSDVPPFHRADDRARRAQTAHERQAAARARQSAAATWGPEQYGPRLVTSFADLAGALFTGADPAALLSQALDNVVGVIPDCHGASLTTWRNATLFDTLATSTAAATLDNLQFVSGEGPAWQAMQEGRQVHVPDLQRVTESPATAAAAGSFGVCQVLACGLVVQGGRLGPALGSLTFYSSNAEPFDHEVRDFIAILAANFAAAVAAIQRDRDLERREASLHRALNTRDVIGQAKGILMERQGLTASEAFDVLRRASQRLNLRLTELAEHLARTGRLPTRTLPPTS